MRRLLLLALLFATLPAGAQVGEVGARVGAALAIVAEAMDAGRDEDALARLEVLRQRRLNPAERALVERTRGYLLARQERFEAAIDALRAALDTGALQGEALQAVRLDLGQLLLAQGRDGEGLALLEAWRADGGRLSAPLVDWIAYAYYRNGRKAEAAALLDEALARFPPRRNWYELRAALYQEAGEDARAVALLQQALDRFPGAGALWRRLAAAQLALERPEAALASLLIADGQGLLGPEDRLHIARLFNQVGAPYHGARLLQAVLDSGALPPEADHWGLVGELLAQARERRAALTAFARAAEGAEDGRWDLRRGELLLETGDWAGAEAALARALERGVEAAARPRAAYLLGVALAQQGRTDEARDRFQTVREDPQLGPYARRWLERLG